jgi:hypothetical protein
MENAVFVASCAFLLLPKCITTAEPPDSESNEENLHKEI